jgi:hypothetical protein
MKRVVAVAAVTILLCLGGIAQAAVMIEVVSVGDGGNPADATGCGAVGYAFNIGKYEVTVGQYTEFLNATRLHTGRTLYSDTMSPQITRNGTDPYTYSVVPGTANEPVRGVSFWNACAFVNWLGNGQGDSDTETGAYTLNNYAESAGGSIIRNPGARWVIPTNNEWYKTAYYAGGPNGGYCNQPTASTYGTVGQYGDGWEWTESVVYMGATAGRMLGGGGEPLDNFPEFKGTSLGDPSLVSGFSGYQFRVADVAAEPPTTGSCCTLEGSCAVTTQAACTGTWNAGGSCEPNPCLATPTERKSWGQIRNDYR